MAKIFHLSMEKPIVQDLTVPEIPDGGEGWLMITRSEQKMLMVNEGESVALPFTTARYGGIDTVNLQSCTAIVYLALSHDSSYYGAWYYHGKGGYLTSKGGLPLPWEIEVPYEHGGRGSDYHVAFSAWKDNDEWPKLIDKLERGGIPADNIAACIRPYNGFETFAVNLQGQVGQAFGKPKVQRVTPLQIEKQSLLSESSGSQEPRTPTCCGCYLTTATCLALGLPDDNPVLNTLRTFRDQVMLATAAGRREVARYYATAPAIVAAIDALPDARELYLTLYATTIAPAARAILEGRNDEAYARYRAMVESLTARCLNRARENPS